jgi:HK97 family phage major capsid protein
MVDELETYVSNQLPSNLPGGSPVTNSTSDIFIAQWDQCLIGIRTNMALEVSRYAADSASSAFQNLAIFWRAYMRVDVQLRHPQAFCVLTGIQ